MQKYPKAMIKKPKKVAPKQQPMQRDNPIFMNNRNKTTTMVIANFAAKFEKISANL